MRRERSGRYGIEKTARTAGYRLSPRKDSTGMNALLDRDNEYVPCRTDSTKSIYVGLSFA
jgi:hypothetical protein